jgi:hypothetical protein
MPAHTTTQDILAPELEALATAAANRLQGAVTETDHKPELHHAVVHAASAAIAAGLPLSAVADAERIGHQRARDQLRPDVLRQITRAARRKRDTELEYEQAVIRGVRLGLGHRELAGAPHVSHGTVRAIIARAETSTGEATAALERGHTNAVSDEQTPLMPEQPDAVGMSEPGTAQAGAVDHGSGKPDVGEPDKSNALTG